MALKNMMLRLRWTDGLHRRQPADPSGLHFRPDQRKSGGLRGCCPAAGIAGRSCSSRAATPRSLQAGPTTPDPADEANAHPETFAHKTIGQVADRIDEILRDQIRGRRLELVTLLASERAGNITGVDYVTGGGLIKTT